MSQLNPRKQAWAKRKRRVRKNTVGTESRPRLNIFRSTKHMYAQIIDDTNGRTLVSLSTLSPVLKEALDERAAAEEAAAKAAEEAAAAEAEAAEGKKKKKKGKKKKAKPVLTGKIRSAHQVGISIAKLAKDKGISKVVFDRNGFLYHGRVKAVADGAREGGLEF